MNFILCYQTPYETVSFITDELMSQDFLPYTDFLSFAFKFVKEDVEGFVTNLNRFFNILIDTNTGTWQVYHKKFDNNTMEDFIKYSEKKQKKTFWNRKKDKVDKIKNFTNDLIDKKYNFQRANQQQFFGDLKRKNLSNLKILE